MGMRWRGVVAAMGLMAALVWVPAASALSLYVVAGAVYPADTATDMLGTPIPTGTNPRAIAITPNGQAAYVANVGSGDVTPINLATGTPGPGIPVGSRPDGIAITPDGTTAFVRVDGGVTPVDLATGTAESTIHAGGGAVSTLEGPAGIAITPDGRTVYVSDQPDNTVIPIDVATRTAGAPISVASNPEAISVTPDGRTVYVVSWSPFDGTKPTLTPIASATNAVGAPIALGNAGATQFTIAPDGRTAYLWTWSRQLIPVDLATGAVGNPLNPGPGPYGGATGQVVMSPDGTFADATLCVSSTGCFGAVAQFDLSTGSDTTITNPSQGLFNLWIPVAAAFEPGPAAAFSSTPASVGQTSRFDATKSVDPGGSVTEYHWSFGDGRQATSTSPTTSHAYAHAGTYSVTLTTENAGGCAAHFVFTGQTISCTGSPNAQITRPLTVTPDAPRAVITSPRSGRTFVQGEKVRTKFTCREGTGGPGLKSCTDNKHGHAPGGWLATDGLGAQTYLVTAASADGQQATAHIAYTVIAAAAHPIAIDTARATVRHRQIKLRLSCSARWPTSPCRGTLTLTIRTRPTSRSHHVKIRALAKRSYAVIRGGAREITVTLTRRALALAEQRSSHGRTSVQVTAAIDHGRPNTRTISLRTG